MSQRVTDLTDEQSKIIFWITKIGGGASILCSLYLITKILRDHIRRKKVYHRIIVALNMNSVIFSGAIFCYSWPAPKSYSIYGALGTQKTCDAQGAVLLFTSSTLASYYLLLSVFAFHSVRNNFDETWFRKFELRVHLSIYIIPTIITVIAVTNDFINPAMNQCYIASYPPGCYLDDKFGKCIRGGPWFKSFAFICLVLNCLSFLISIILFIGLIFSVRRKEQINAKLIEEKFETMFRGKQLFREKARQKKSRVILQQASIYAMMYLFLFMVPTFIKVPFVFRKEESPFGCVIVIMLFISLSGCINLIVYLLLLKRKQDPTYISTLPPLRDRIYLSPSQEKALNTPEEVSKSCLDRPEFSIFDGRNPSDSPWAQFIDDYSDDENDVNDFQTQEIVP